MSGRDCGAYRRCLAALSTQRDLSIEVEGTLSVKGGLGGRKFSAVHISPLFTGSKPPPMLETDKLKASALWHG